MKYETVIIFSPELDDTVIDGALKKIEDLVTKNSGSIIKTEHWKKKRLAYPVKKHIYGYYVLIQLDAPPKLISDLERHYRVTENIIKYLTLKISDLKKKKDVVSPSAEGGEDVAAEKETKTDSHNSEMINATMTKETNKGD